MCRHDLAGDSAVLLGTEDGDDHARCHRRRDRGAKREAAQEVAPRRACDGKPRAEAAGRAGRVGRRRSQGRLDAAAQMGRRLLFQLGGSDGRAHRTKGRELVGATAARRHMRLDLACVAGVELAVDQRMNKHFGFGAVHVVDPSSPFHAARSMDRARASRDITVPRGMPATSAISR